MAIGCGNKNRFLNTVKEQYMDDVVIVEYDPFWPDLFVQEAERVRAVLSGRTQSVRTFPGNELPF